MGIRNLALCLLSIRHRPEISHWSTIKVSHKSEASTQESFEPIDYAAKAYTLIKTALDTYDPHTILIERQRYRTAGGAAIQEWTVRVNMLESMFHATLHTFSQIHACDFDVYSVSPRKVTQLWLGEGRQKLNARETKFAKMDVAQRIVNGKETDVSIDIIGQAKTISELFAGESKAGPQKLDDLADSMLQGLAWWKWNLNRSKMLDEILNGGFKDENNKSKSKTRRRQVTIVAN